MFEQRIVLVDFLINTPPHIVIIKLQLHAACGIFRFDQTVFTIPGVRPGAVRQHIAVRIISRNHGIHRCILVKRIRCISIDRSGKTGAQTVPDRIERIHIAVGAVHIRSCSRHFRTVVVTVVQCFRPAEHAS